ncbi:hypothetical protein EUGRSUZ_F00575 [Eucalyptus grandis]|uniref:Uncharacterized protein n=2 Tax=Eucalyptus grandis TaxID=71139 RepID=A0ACC3KBR8_EUCGR|nr:hypothetical protein EUGRSUZ_F00575 [Eucalyptus grandis]
MFEKESEGSSISLSLREVEPELMDASIEVTKDGDESRLQTLSVSEAWVGEDNDKGGEDFEHDHGEEKGVPGFYLLLKKKIYIAYRCYSKFHVHPLRGKGVQLVRAA